MKNKLILTLIMSISLVKPMYGAGIQDINLPALQAQFIDKAKELEPVVSTVINKLNAGDFAGLKTYLNGLGSLNLAPAITFLSNNMGTIKNAILEALNSIPYSQLPGNYQETIKNAVEMVKNNVGRLSSIGEQLPKIASYANITDHKESILSALNDVIHSQQFQAIKPQILGSYNSQIKPYLTQIAATDTNKIKDAIVVAISKASGQQLSLMDLTKLAQGLSVVRKLAPAIPGLIEGISTLALTLNNVLVDQKSINKLPAQAQEAIKGLQLDGKTISSALQDVNEQINKAVASMQ